MLKYLFGICTLMFWTASYGAPWVPDVIEFAGIKLVIDAAAKQEIQADVDALHRSKTYFDRRIETVDLYFPIIEKIFKEQNIPEDFKYLAIQESGLQPDAVSVSNAVGFWQFKAATAREVGLRIDHQIDERMNLTASTHGAARYLKKINMFFDNWVYALMAYNTGPGGAQQHVQQKYFGAKKMAISKKTHWYIKKFLAHKIAFETAVGTIDNTNSVRLYEYNETQGKSLKEIADEFRIDSEQITQYNKWIKRGKIPADKAYTAILPVAPSDAYALRLLNADTDIALKPHEKRKFAFTPTYRPASEFDFQQSTNYPVVKKAFLTKKIRINGIPGFRATDSDRLSNVTVRHGISLKKFMKYNELTAADEIVEGQVYYLKAKKSKAAIHYHVVVAGETAWSISQKYGVKVTKLLKKNRFREEKNLEAGMVMWLRFIRPPDVAVEYRKSDAKNLVVKSSSNQIIHSDKQTEQQPPQAKPVPSEATTQANTQELPYEKKDDLFEEVDQSTRYIDEHSYISTNTQEDAKPESEKPESPNSPKPAFSSEISEKGTKYHIVQLGETLYSISKIYGVGIEEIRSLNQMGELDLLNVGQKIIISQPKQHVRSQNQQDLAGSYATYTVKKNDTLYSIARENGLTIKELMEMNGKDDFDIHEGEVLRIKNLQ
jgi:membrane-bound lytic murein transglycosylase D